MDPPRLGSAMPVVLHGMDDDPRWAQMALPQAGGWVRLRNVAACVIEGQVQVRDPCCRSAAAAMQRPPRPSTAVGPAASHRCSTLTLGSGRAPGALSMAKARLPRTAHPGTLE